MKALQTARMTDANGRPSPHVEGIQYQGPTEDDKLTPHLITAFQSILDQLRYITDCTRPELAYYVSRLTSGPHKPTRRHWLIMEHVLRYLKQTVDDGIIHHKFSTDKPISELTSYADADFAGDLHDRKSMSGSVHLFNHSPVSRAAVKQATVALSTCEAEYTLATSAVQVTVWLRRMLQELKRTAKGPTPLHIDNLSAITVARNTAPTRKRKCIDVKHHYCKSTLSNVTSLWYTLNPPKCWQTSLPNLLDQQKSPC